MPIYKEELVSLKRYIHTQRGGCWMDMCVHCSTVRFTGVRVCVCMDIRTYVHMCIHMYVFSCHCRSVLHLQTNSFK